LATSIGAGEGAFAFTEVSKWGQKTNNIHVILNGAPLRYESRRLEKRDSSLRQNDKNSLLIGHWYQFFCSYVPHAVDLTPYDNWQYL
jgi:hypothetical protein